jgi:hypothetical protein
MERSIDVTGDIDARGNVVVICGDNLRVRTSELDIPVDGIAPLWFDMENEELLTVQWRELQLEMMMPTCRHVPSRVWDGGVAVLFDWTMVVSRQESRCLHLRGYPGVGRTTALFDLALSLPEGMFPVYIDCNLGNVDGQKMFQRQADALRWAKVLCKIVAQPRHAKSMVVLLDNYDCRKSKVMKPFGELEYADHLIILACNDGCQSCHGPGWEVAVLPSNSETVEPIVASLFGNRALLSIGMNYVAAWDFFEPRLRKLVPTPRQYRWLLQYNLHEPISLREALLLLKLPFWSNWKLGRIADSCRLETEIRRVAKMNEETITEIDCGLCTVPCAFSTWRLDLDNVLVLPRSVATDDVGLFERLAMKSVWSWVKCVTCSRDERRERRDDVMLLANEEHLEEGISQSERRQIAIAMALDLIVVLKVQVRSIFLRSSASVFLRGLGAMLFAFAVVACLISTVLLSGGMSEEQVLVTNSSVVFAQRVPQYFVVVFGYLRLNSSSILIRAACCSYAKMIDVAALDCVKRFPIGVLAWMQSDAVPILFEQVLLNLELAKSLPALRDEPMALSNGGNIVLFIFLAFGALGLGMILVSFVIQCVRYLQFKKRETMTESHMREGFRALVAVPPLTIRQVLRFR